jgi:alkylation response protein AidB-like acyl-CoA dehydrogenase
MTSEDLDSAPMHEYRLQARAWLAANMSPVPRDGDGNAIADGPTADRFARARVMQARLFDGGYAGITYPAEYGGGGLDLDHERVFLEEAASFDMPTRDFGVSLNIVGKTLLRFGTDDQKRAHIPKMLAGEEIWLQLLSEPSGGSDIAGLIARADKDGASYLLNGQKTWSTGALYADFAMCPVRTNWRVPKHQGITMFIVDLRAPGIEIRPIRQIDGGAEFCEEFLTDVVVSADDIVGEENDGWTVMRGLLEIEHEWVGRAGPARSGTHDADVDDLVALVRRRGLEHDEGARRSVAEVRERMTVHRVLAGRVSSALASGQLDQSYGNLLKLGSGLLAQKRAETALELAGSSAIAWRPGSSEESIVGEHLRTRRLTIASGTSEIQRNNISERALALPRETSPDRDRPFDEVVGG